VQELCECDHIIQEKQTRIDHQNKVFAEIQITLDEKVWQIEALRSSLADRDASLSGLEGQRAKSEANICNLEAKLDAAIHAGNRLREEVILLMGFVIFSVDDVLVMCEVHSLS
jgi:predicted  nucleic acid-binding Zn-ribbon protein